MRIVTHEFKTEYFSSELFRTYFNDMSLCVFDIETTGLNPACCSVILAAVMEIEPDGDCLITQYFAEEPGDEAGLLDALMDNLNRFDILLTYNGKHFDIPFVLTRAEKLGLKRDLYGNSPLRAYDLDLFLILNGHSEIKKITHDLKQKTVERYMGIAASRDDDISGAESVELFRKYLSLPCSGIKDALGEKILLHNHDDVAQLYRLLPVIRRTDFHRAMNRLGFPVSGQNGWRDIMITRAVLTGSELVIRGSHNQEGFSFRSFVSQSEPVAFEFDCCGTFKASVPVKKIRTPEGASGTYADLKYLIRDPRALQHLGGYVKGFLVLCENNLPGYAEINLLAKSVLTDFMAGHPI